MDYERERLLDNISKGVALSNQRFAITDGKQLRLTDDQACVGDVVSLNAYMAARISFDGILLSREGIEVDGSAISGEPKPISRSDMAPFMISGTTINAGQGTIVLAVGSAASRERSRSRSARWTTARNRSSPTTWTT